MAKKKEPVQPITEFTCPHCKKVQDKIGVISECTQTLSLPDDSWNDMEAGDTKGIYCLECGRPLPGLYRKLLKTEQI